MGQSRPITMGWGLASPKFVGTAYIRPYGLMYCDQIHHGNVFQGVKFLGTSYICSHGDAEQPN